MFDRKKEQSEKKSTTVATIVSDDNKHIIKWKSREKEIEENENKCLTSFGRSISTDVQQMQTQIGVLSVENELGKKHKSERI